MSRDLLYYLSLKRCTTFNHSGQNRTRDNKTFVCHSISIYIGYVASRHPILNFYLIQWVVLGRSRDSSYQHFKAKVSWRRFVLYCGQIWRGFWRIPEKLWLFPDFMQIRLWAMPNMLEWRSRCRCRRRLLSRTLWSSNVQMLYIVDDALSCTWWL